LIKLIVDNDVLIKAVLFDLLPELEQLDCPPECDAEVGVLGAARFVVTRHVEQESPIQDVDRRIDVFTDFLSRVILLEPDDAEIALATDLEDSAAREGLELDTGESQLVAILLLRSCPVLLTGDKRAIAGLEHLVNTFRALDPIEGRVACFEQAMQTLVDILGPNTVREIVCTRDTVDQTLTICFECHRSVVPDPFELEGLQSYIRELRAIAPRVLLDGERLLIHAA
jgi:hypothetical protein